MTDDFLVSVLITTKNDEKTIEALLSSIFMQSYTNVEVICVDNFSTDSTYEIIKSYKTLHLQSGPERSAQRNLALSKASGEWVLWLDADMILKVDTIKECVKRIKNNDQISALVIQEEVPGNDAGTKIRNFENSLYLKTTISTPRFLLNDVLSQVQGFDENLTGAEDWDMARRYLEVAPNLDYVVSSASCGIYHIENDLSFPMYLKKKHYYAFGCNEYEKKWGSNDKIVKSQLRPIPRLINILTTPGNFIRILAHPFLTVGMLLWRSFPAFMMYIAPQDKSATSGAISEKIRQEAKRKAES